MSFMLFSLHVSGGCYHRRSFKKKISLETFCRSDILIKLGYFLPHQLSMRMTDFLR